MLASDVLGRVRLVLQDEDAVRWTESEVLQWITDGQRVIVLVRPDACVQNQSVDLVEGTKQTIPDGGLRLLDIVRNMSDNRAVRLVDREVLDTADPGWHARKGSAAIRNYAYDNRDPTVFYVSPPAMKPDPKAKPAKATLEIIYSVAPPKVEAAGDTLALTDIYIDPLVNYALFRCYSKDAQFAQNMQIAAAYLQSCMAMLGVKTKKDVAFSPDLTSKGALPNAPAIQMEGM